jgi:hypothetical protein
VVAITQKKIVNTANIKKRWDGAQAEDKKTRISILIHRLTRGEECHHLVAKVVVSVADEALVVARRIMARRWILLVLGPAVSHRQRRPPWAATILHLLRQEEPRITLS